jgi:nitrogen regulatory protein P-II 1
MKNLTLIVHAEVKQALADTLRGLKLVRGFTFTSVEGHGAHGGEDAFLSARDRVVGYVPHMRVDLLLEDRDVEPVLKALHASNCGVAGRGVFWVTPLERQGRL